jgi:hypothetical protein
MTTPQYCQLTKALLASAGCIAAFAGCGQSHSVAQVRGKVVCKNAALPESAIRIVRFEPTADSSAAIRKGASGVINDDGSFELYTRKPGDGVHIGKYAVTFVFYKGAMDHTSPIAKKFTSAATTPYRIVVEDDVDNLEFEIETIGAGAPQLRN